MLLHPNPFMFIPYITCIKNRIFVNMKSKMLNRFTFLTLFYNIYLLTYLFGYSEVMNTFQSSATEMR